MAKVWPFETILQNSKVLRGFCSCRARRNLVETKGFNFDKAMKKRGAPKNEGKSNDVYENKGQEFRPFELETILLKTQHLWISSNDVYENTRT